MAADRLTRSTPADLEVRGVDGRTVVGVAVPFDQPTEIADPTGRYTETFKRGAFARTIAERAGRVKFLANHNHQALPVGRAVLLREDPAGLYGEFKVSATVAGDELLELVRDGAVDALSVGFRPLRDSWDAARSAVERLEVALLEVSAVAFAAYAAATIVAVRSDAEARLAAVDPPHDHPVLPLEVARRRLAIATLEPHHA